MGFMNFFKPMNEITPDMVRKVIESEPTDKYSLLDVRQPGEYAQGHLPGAVLIPLGELMNRLGEIRRDRKTIVYCRSGNRSGSAVNLLAGQGIENVFNMTGGIMSYNGLVAGGEPQAGLFCFPEDLTPGQSIAVAWLKEDGNRIPELS